MKRRSPIVMLALAAATLTAGCTTFSDNDVAVRVDDLSYSHEDVNDLVIAVGLPEDDLENIRLFATDLVVVGAIGGWLEEMSVDVTEANREAGRTRAQAEAPGFADLDDDLQQTLADFFAVIDSANSIPDIQAALSEALDDADVYVDPRIGTFDTAVGAVIALG